MGEPDAECPGRLGDSGCLVVGHGVGCDFYFPHPRVRPQPVRLPVREYPDHHYRRYSVDIGLGGDLDRYVLAFPPGDRLRGVRPGFRCHATPSGQMDRICNDVLHRCYDRTLDPLGGNYVVNELADFASGYGEPVHVRLQENHLGKYRDRLLGVRGGTGAVLLLKRTFRGVHYPGFGCPLFGDESNKTVVPALNNV